MCFRTLQWLENYAAAANTIHMWRHNVICHPYIVI